MAWERGARWVVPAWAVLRWPCDRLAGHLRAAAAVPTDINQENFPLRHTYNASSCHVVSRIRARWHIFHSLPCPS